MLHQDSTCHIRYSLGLGNLSDKAQSSVKQSCCANNAVEV